jgi:hypothetical protein
MASAAAAVYRAPCSKRDSDITGDDIGVPRQLLCRRHDVGDAATCTAVSTDMVAGVTF